MKTIQLITTLIACCAAFFSCVQDNNFEVPNDVSQNDSIRFEALMTALENGSKSMIDIADLKLLYNSEPVEIAADLVVEGYVSSSDRTGNFYKEFYIQDQSEDPLAGLKISLNMTDSYNFVNQGRKIFIDLKGLYLGELNHGDGVLCLGGQVQGNEIVQMSSNVARDVIIRSTLTESLVPLVVPIAEINPAHIGLFVSFDNIQFPITLDGQFFVDPTDDYDSQRIIESCAETSTFLLETSAFADFAQDQLPLNGSGSISGIVTKDYYGDNMVLALNQKSDIVMNSSRCDPLFVDTFSSSNLNKWTAYSLAGDQIWEVTGFGNPGPSAVISGFSGGAVVNEDWLITQAIDMTQVSSGTLTFQTVKRYSGPDLELYMCTDYGGGDPNIDGSWTLLSAVFDTNTGSWSSWTDSGEVDVSAASGSNLFIAFKYVSTGTAAATFELDNVLVK